MASRMESNSVRRSLAIINTFKKTLIICRIITAKINAYHVRLTIALYSNGYNFNDKTLFYI